MSSARILSAVSFKITDVVVLAVCSTDKGAVLLILAGALIGFSRYFTSLMRISNLIIKFKKNICIYFSLTNAFHNCAIKARDRC